MSTLLFIAAATGFVFLYGIRLLVTHFRQQHQQLYANDADKGLVTPPKPALRSIDRIGNRIIALDGEGQTLVFVDQNRHEKKSIFIPVHAIKQTQVMVEKNKQDCIHRVLLQVTHIGSRSIDTFCFFDHAHDSVLDLTKLAQKARHWKSRLDGNRFPGMITPAEELVH